LIVLDGPAGAGKSTVARRLAAHYGLAVLDTGAIYRSLALLAWEQGVDWEDETGLLGVLENFALSFLPPLQEGEAQRVMVNGRDVTSAIRTPLISEGASVVSAGQRVRKALLALQRELGSLGCVAEGRDMGTVVFPEADFKFFLTASPRARALRRHAELEARGHQPLPSVDEVERELAARDLRDRVRETAPMVQASDAVAIDSSSLDSEATLAALIAVIDGKEPR
jgi:cytidylate kinase